MSLCKPLPTDFLSSLTSSTPKPGGHLFLSTIARTPLAYMTNIFLAEDALQLVSKGTHSYSKFIKPSELVSFFTDEVPWISRLYSGTPSRVEAEIRDMAYNPLSGKWSVLPRGTSMPVGTECNYLFWVRRPLSA